MLGRLGLILALILATGYLSTTPDAARYEVASPDAAGDLDTTFGDPNANSSVVALALQPDGKVLIGGSFTLVGGVTRKYVARLHADSVYDNSFGGPNANSSVVALALQSDGKVLIGGWFTSVGGQARYRVARLQISSGSTICTATGLGNWSAPATWSCGHVPGPGEAVVIPAGFTVTLDQDVTLDSDLDVQGTLISNDKTVTLTGDQAQTLKGNPLTFYNLVVNKTNKTDVVTIEGKLKVTKKLTITKGKLKSASDYEDIEIGADGELELTSAITVGGNFTNSGTLTTNGHGVTFDGGKEQNLAANVLTFFDDLTVAAGTMLVEIVSDDNVLVNGVLTNNGVIRNDVSTFSDWAVGNNVTANAVTLREFRAAPQFDLAAWLAELLHRLGAAR